jgi:hypothetical protein
MIERLAGAHRRLLEAEIAKLLRFEAGKAERAMKTGTLSRWIPEFYGQHADHVREVFIPVVDTFIETVWATTDGGEIPVQVQHDACDFTAEMVTRHVARSLVEAEAGNLGANGRVGSQVDAEMGYLVRFAQERLAN